ncbi:LysM peptidoglycan-binding domain-containing protein [Jannaschia seohaensis]|uniref:Polar amino acid transport system substrate-binding protein n=1 Tax=Jannaschia seohaensis TaxID=475081 RepID=A0A2Y9A558_9RHOB|nr:LysM peptidoglycan-binding domain-containing protein [Jannaschia seohaensis]PWJ22310.1 polar amino acid transport system substrate-binding protein [Jannaschia seohaensis]SSA38588.1 polar amino acid transport system substrate-binding protein [Jannaschia seohaensis]
MANGGVIACTKAKLTTGTMLATGVFAALGGVALSTSDAQAQELCSRYVVARGDTLGKIADRAQVPGGYRALYRANRDVLYSPHMMEVGQVLTIPCPEGARAPASAETAVVQIATPAAAEPEPELSADEPIVFLTGSGFAPFTDEGLPEGGAITQMVKRALELADPDREFKVIFVNDWGAHLGDLLPTAAFDMGFPWSLPDCDKVELLSPANARRCTDFAHSDPLYQEGVSYYTLAGSPYVGATTPEELYGATICRPDGWFSFDLEGRGLTEPNVSLLWPGNQLDCWSKMQAGEVDVITYDTQVAKEDMRELGLDGQIAELSDLKGATTMHVFVPKNDPASVAYLETLNEGLAELRLSGEWFSIVREQVQATVMN